MKLLDFMRANALDDASFAAKIGRSAAAVKNWKYGAREPDAATMLSIEQATGGKVALSDWASQSNERKTKRLAAPQPGEAA